jgi:hypothetical protein
MTGRYYFPLLALSFLALSCLAAECNASHMSFQSQYSLGKQDEFNRSFTKIQQQLPPVPAVVYTGPSGYHYNISDVKATFYYRDSKQTATARGEDVIIIEGGRAEVGITFTWHKNSSFSPNTGTGSASAVS